MDEGEARRTETAQGKRRGKKMEASEGSMTLVTD